MLPEETFLFYSKTLQSVDFWFLIFFFFYIILFHIILKDLSKILALALQT